MNHFVVIGNPINHSQSPRIHRLFSEQTGIPLSYDTRYSEIEQFESVLSGFFAKEGYGANITSPFKERAYAICDHLSERAEVAGAVNTIMREPGGTLFGDNTDGVGLIRDLQRLEMIVPKQKILLLGAGGAARGILLPLLQTNAKVIISNRTYLKSVKLAEHFAPYGDISAITMDDLVGKQYDLVINATSFGLNRQPIGLPDSFINEKTAYYDLFYQANLTPFLTWCLQNGAKKYADGLGMLVAQAAYAFYLWHKVMPNINSVIQQLRRELENPYPK